ncbi:hypothetical protein BGZ60DRAFT_384641 [Tricladium varicosporioides]|nr:hypothetical protein BGZ60DRAFT_384641 [Hymenoscyphus varicosporioides]
MIQLPKSEDEPTIIQLQVGEKRFLTTRETLADAKFFDPLLSGRWESNKQHNGSYFINADASLFEHILRYLRRGLLPLFYHNQNGHNHALYITLLQEARYFLITKLIE